MSQINKNINETVPSANQNSIFIDKNRPSFNYKELNNRVYSDKTFNFLNQCFDKGRIKNFVLWFLINYGEHKTVKLLDELKSLGFEFATKAGISLGIDDLKIPPKKSTIILEAEKYTQMTVQSRGDITGVERFQRLIDTWHRTSEVLKQEVINHFEATDILNPVYMMAFSGARGNISQVRQLVGMRGLMADPQGQILDFPIRSNFREGLTLTEYVISSYGARKGIVDTALRTANAGYLTRRLVDVAQHVIVSHFDCGTRYGILLTDIKEGNKTLVSLQNRLLGRILARDIFKSGYNKSLTSDGKNKNNILAFRNQEISIDLAFQITQVTKKVFVRSPLTCETQKLVCQLCYGWSLAQGNLVSVGEAVGIVAGQSIGEPGTQLTMRTFHTGGVFSGDVTDQIKAPFNGIILYNNAIPGNLIRTLDGKIAFLTKTEGKFSIVNKDVNQPFLDVKDKKNLIQKNFKIPPYTLLFVRNGDQVIEKEVVAQISTISQGKGNNITDEAELVLKSEIEGEFVTENLIVKYYSSFFSNKNLSKSVETKGDKAKVAEPTVSFGQTFNQNSTVSQFSNKIADSNIFYSSNKSTTDFVQKAWDWGYAWILSGKIYQLYLHSQFLPQSGDYIHKGSVMNETFWNLKNSYFNRKSSFIFSSPYLNIGKQANKYDVKKTIPTLMSSTANRQLGGITRLKKVSNNSNKFNSNNYLKISSKARFSEVINKKGQDKRISNVRTNSVKAIKKSVFSAFLSKISFEKIGYILKFLDSGNFENTSQFFALSKNDCILSLSGMYNKVHYDIRGFDHSNNSILNNQLSSEGLAYNQMSSKIPSRGISDPSQFDAPSKWIPFFKYFLSWVPAKTQSSTGGLISLQNLFYQFGSFYFGLSKIRYNRVSSVLETINLKSYTNLQKLKKNNRSGSIQSQSKGLDINQIDTNSYVGNVNPTKVGFTRHYLKNQPLSYKTFANYSEKETALLTKNNKKTKSTEFDNTVNYCNLAYNLFYKKSFFSFLKKWHLKLKFAAKTSNTLDRQSQIDTDPINWSGLRSTYVLWSKYNNKNKTIRAKNQTNKKNKIKKTKNKSSSKHFKTKLITKRTFIGNYINNKYIVSKNLTINKLDKKKIAFKEANFFSSKAGLSGINKQTTPSKKTILQKKSIKKLLNVYFTQNKYNRFLWLPRLFFKGKLCKNLILRNHFNNNNLNFMYSLNRQGAKQEVNISNTNKNQKLNNYFGVLVKQQNPLNPTKVSLTKDFTRHSKLQKSTSIVNPTKMGLTSVKEKSNNIDVLPFFSWNFNFLFGSLGNGINIKKNNIAFCSKLNWGISMLTDNNQNKVNFCKLLENFQVNIGTSKNKWYKSKVFKNLNTYLSIRNNKQLPKNLFLSFRGYSLNLIKLYWLKVTQNLNRAPREVFQNFIFSDSIKQKISDIRLINEMSFLMKKTQSYQTRLTTNSLQSNLQSIQISFLGSSKPSYSNFNYLSIFINRKKYFKVLNSLLHHLLLHLIQTLGKLSSQTQVNNRFLQLNQVNQAFSKKNQKQFKNIDNSLLNVGLREQKVMKNGWVFSPFLKNFKNNRDKSQKLSCFAYEFSLCTNNTFVSPGKSLNFAYRNSIQNNTQKLSSFCQEIIFDNNIIYIDFFYDNKTVFKNFKLNNYNYGVKTTSLPSNYQTHYDVDNTLVSEPQLSKIKEQFFFASKKIVNNKSRFMPSIYLNEYIINNSKSFTSSAQPFFLIFSKIKQWSIPNKTLVKNDIMTLFQNQKKNNNRFTLQQNKKTKLPYSYYAYKTYSSLLSFRLGLQNKQEKTFEKLQSFGSSMVDFDLYKNSIISQKLASLNFGGKILRTSKILTNAIPSNKKVGLLPPYFINKVSSYAPSNGNFVDLTNPNTNLAKSGTANFGVSVIAKSSNVGFTGGKQSKNSTITLDSYLMHSLRNSNCLFLKEKAIFFSKKSFNLSPFLIYLSQLNLSLDIWKFGKIIPESVFSFQSYVGTSKNTAIKSRDLLKFNPINSLNSNIYNINQVHGVNNSKIRFSNQNAYSISLLHKVVEQPYFDFCIIQRLNFLGLQQMEPDLNHIRVKPKRQLSIYSTSKSLSNDSISSVYGNKPIIKPSTSLKTGLIGNNLRSSFISNNLLNLSPTSDKMYISIGQKSCFDGEFLIKRKYNWNVSDLLSAYILKNIKYKKTKASKQTQFLVSPHKGDKPDINTLNIINKNATRCLILTKSDQISYFLPKNSYKLIAQDLIKLKQNKYVIEQKDNFNKNSIQISSGFPGQLNNVQLGEFLVYGDIIGIKEKSIQPKSFNMSTLKSATERSTSLIKAKDLDNSNSLEQKIAVKMSGQIIHLNNNKVTLRKGQPILISPKAVLHSVHGDFVTARKPVITLSYQKLKTGDIVQGIPKVEQFFEARTTKRGRLFLQSVPNLLSSIFKRYSKKYPLQFAVRQSFYKIQQVLVDGVMRVYRSQGVSLADKHLEVIVKQMTTKVRILEGGQTGFFPGEIVDLDFVNSYLLNVKTRKKRYKNLSLSIDNAETINNNLLSNQVNNGSFTSLEMNNNLAELKIFYEPIVLGITKASLEVDSFLSAASFQQTTKVLSKAAISKKKDFLKGLKENVLLGNLIPAGTGYLVYLNKSSQI